MRNYEVTFIVDPVLSGDEIKGTAQAYVDFITDGGGKIVHVDEMGLRQLAYPINKRSSGIYYSVEFEIENGNIIAKLELSMRRDERIMRFLSAALDKYGVKYNEDKRAGKIGKVKKKEKEKKKDDRRGGRSSGPSKPAASKPAPKEAAPKEEVAVATPKEAASKEEVVVAAPKEVATKVAAPAVAPVAVAESEEE